MPEDAANFGQVCRPDSLVVFFGKSVMGRTYIYGVLIEFPFPILMLWQKLGGHQ